MTDSSSPLAKLTTETRNPNSARIDSLSAREIVDVINSEDAQIASAVGAESDAIARAIDVIAEAFRQGGRLIYMGAGTSGRLGVLDASECPPTFNSPPGLVVGLIAGGPQALTTAIEGAEDNPQQGEDDLVQAQLQPIDVVVGIATSGRTPYVIGGVQHAGSIGCTTIGFACNDDSELSRHVDLMIAPIVGPEVVSGSTRMKAGTATKMVLNMLTTGAMIRTGKTYGNLMVDLRATNSKLKLRAARIVGEMTGLSAADATELLGRCGGELKPAIVAHLLDIQPHEANERLRSCDGHLRAALMDHDRSPPDQADHSDTIP
ncbi:MAG: N-acetylmuramic acid 6-phosphate etherase [Planctomycetota bacterium]